MCVFKGPRPADTESFCAIKPQVSVHLFLGESSMVELLHTCISLPPSQHVANAAHSVPLSTCMHTQRLRWLMSWAYAGAQVSTFKKKKNARVEFSHRNTVTARGRKMENTQERKVHRRAAAGAVGDEGCRKTGRPWGPEQVICLKHEQTEHTLTWQM